MNIPIKLAEGATLPAQARRGDAGYDLCCLHNATMLPGERWVATTGVSRAIPPGHYGRIAPRSGLAAKKGIDVLGGVVDCAYRGDIGVILLNTSKDVVTFDAGDKIAQLIIETCHSANFTIVDYLDNTDRGAGGFGHTGR